MTARLFQAKSVFQGDSVFRSNSVAQAIPVRTCVVCRKPGNRKELLRFTEKALDPAARHEERELFVDVRATAEGRGAYCHVTVGCLGHKKVLVLLRSSLKRPSLKRSFARGASKTRALAKHDVNKVAGESVAETAPLTGGTFEPSQVVSGQVAGEKAASREAGLEKMVQLLKRSVAVESRRKRDRDKDRAKTAIITKVIQELEKPVQGPSTSLRPRGIGGSSSTLVNKQGKGKLRF